MTLLTADQNTRKLLTKELMDKVEKRVREMLDLASAIWPDHTSRFNDAPEIRYDIKNRFGGVAISGGKDDWTIRLNLILCYENEAHFIETTVAHEVAHLVQRVVHGSTKQVLDRKTGQMATKKIRSHGPEWKAIMVKFGLPPATAARVASPLRGYTVRVMTAQERVADIKDFGREIRKSKESAVAFLQSAGILDQTGELAEPFRVSSIQTKKRPRSKRGAKLTLQQTMDMIRRLETGFRRLSPHAQRSFVVQCQETIDRIELESN